MHHARPSFLLVFSSPQKEGACTLRQSQPLRQSDTLQFSRSSFWDFVNDHHFSRSFEVGRLLASARGRLRIEAAAM
jgi:hypothetical protein